MKRVTRSKGAAIADINITPLLDLAWTLLIIFIIATTATVQGIELTLPESEPNETEMETTTLTISVNKEGKIYLDDELVNIRELEGLLRNLKKAKNGELPVVLKGDEGVQYKYVVAVIDILQKVPLPDLAIQTKPFKQLGL